MAIVSRTSKSIRYLLILLTATIGSMAAAQSTNSQAPSGIVGRVVRGPMCGGPVRVDHPCADAPYQTMLVIKRRLDQRVVRTVETDGNGDFRAEIPPGRYFIVNEPAKGYPRIYSLDILVRPHRFTTMNIQADTGMR
jgi:hypothetical protein